MATPEAVFAGSSWDKRLYAGMLIVLAALAATSLADHSVAVKVVGSVIGVLLFASALRAPRWGRIEVFSDHVAVRSLWRTRRFRWPDVERFIVQKRRVLGSPLPANHRTLGVQLVTGRIVWVPPANASSRAPAPTWVDRAADALNRHLRTAVVSE